MAFFISELRSLSRSNLSHVAELPVHCVLQFPAAQRCEPVHYHHSAQFSIDVPIMSQLFADWHSIEKLSPFSERHRHQTSIVPGWRAATASWIQGSPSYFQKYFQPNGWKKQGGPRSFERANHRSKLNFHNQYSGRDGDV